MKVSKKHAPDGTTMSVAKVGEEGQVALPQDICKMFGIEPGEELLMLADDTQGIALAKPGFFTKMGVKAIAGHVPEGKAMEFVKVGDNRQIVIPKNIREMLDIVPGENLLLLADSAKGIAICGLSTAEEDPDEADA